MPMTKLLITVRDTVRVLHPQLFVSLLTVVLILGIPQVKDLVRIFAEEETTLQTLLALVGILLLNFSIWATGRWLTIRHREHKGKVSTPLSLLEKWSPRLLAILPQLALIVVIFNLASSNASTNPTMIFLFYGVVLVISAVIFLYFVYTRRSNASQRVYGSDKLISVRRGPFQWPVWTYGVFAGAVVIFFLTFFDHAKYTQYLGTLFITFSFLTLLTVLLTLIVWKSKKHKVSIFGLLTILAIVIAAYDLSDNHTLALAGFQVHPPGDDDQEPQSKSIKEGKLTANIRPDTRTHFEDWLKSLKKENENVKIAGKTPIYLVAAQGGGIYAAFHAAMTLATIEDRCPGFAKHLFAISSVSGGSLGSVLFTELIRDKRISSIQGKDTTATDPSEKLLRSSGDKKLLSALPHCQSIEDTNNVEEAKDEQENFALRNKVGEVFKDDWLAPVVAKTLFAEPILTFLPIPCTGVPMLGKFCSALDQAKALEASLVRSTSKVLDDKTRDKSNNGNTHALWRGMSSYYHSSVREDFIHLPQLLINTADSNTGTRVVIAPFKLKGVNMALLDDYLPVDKEPSLAEAAVLSARFPFFTQAGSWEGGSVEEQFRRLSNCEARYNDGANEQQNTPCAGNGNCQCNKIPTKVRFVDGGYSDNSGLQTLDDLITELKNSDTDLSGLEFHVISLTGLNQRSIGGSAFNELGTPIKATLKMWGAKAREAREEFIIRYSGQSGGYSGVVYQANLDTKTQSIPLGWRLSKRSRKGITEQISITQCDKTKPAECGAVPVASNKTDVR